jgi:FtsZ-binding cell division protein ZapB
MLALLACFGITAIIFFFGGVVTAECDRKTITYTMDDMSDEIKKLKNQLHTEQRRVAILERENQETRSANHSWYEKAAAMAGHCVDAHHAVDEVEQKLKATWAVLVFSVFVVSISIFLSLLTPLI